LKYNFPHGFVLSELALYAFVCQDVYPDVISFAAAIPDHLKPLFLIPIQMEMATASSEIAHKIACSRHANSPDADLFGTSTFVNDDAESTVPSSEPGSIFQVDDADDITHHQEYDYDQNIQVPTDTTFMSDVVPEDEGFDYPYNTKQRPVHSSKNVPFVAIVKLHVALKPEQLETHAPPKIRENARACTVSLVSYDDKSKVFTFAVDAGNGAKQVQAKLSEIDQVSMSCNCPFWRWNGPEFHAKENSFMLDSPFGTAETPNVRDPDRKYWLCKHAYAVLKRLDSFVQEVVDENWDKDEDELLETVESEWDRLEGAAKVPLEDAEDDDIELEIDWDGDDKLDLDEAEGEAGEEQSEEGEQDDGSVDVDLSELEEPEGQGQESPPSQDYETPSGKPEESVPPPAEEDYEAEESEEDPEESSNPEEDYEAEEEAEEEQEEEELEEDYEASQEEQEPSKK